MFITLSFNLSLSLSSLRACVCVCVRACVCVCVRTHVHTIVTSVKLGIKRFKLVYLFCCLFVDGLCFTYCSSAPDINVHTHTHTHTIHTTHARTHTHNTHTYGRVCRNLVSWVRQLRISSIAFLLYAHTTRARAQRFH